MKMKAYALGVLAVFAWVLPAAPAGAADKYWSGTGAWTTGSGGNWSTTSGSGYSTATWSSGDSAIFEGTSGTVTLGENISLNALVFSIYGYTVSGNTLDFSLGGSITNKVESGYGDTQPVLTISSAITGSPTVWAAAGTGSGPSYNFMKFAPTIGTVTLGKVSLGYADGNGGDKGWIWLSGVTTGNSVSEIVDLGGYSQVKQDSGSWTYGNISAGIVRLLGGNMILTGTVRMTYMGFSFTGGTLAGTGTVTFASSSSPRTLTVPLGGTIAPGNPTGTLTIGTNIITGTNFINGTLAIYIDGMDCSMLDVKGLLTITNSTLSCTVVRKPMVPVVIATYGSLLGPFAATNGISGWEVDYNYKGSNQIVVIPPPSATILIIR